MLSKSLKKETIAICGDCEYFHPGSVPSKCSAPEAPYFDFINGRKHCASINIDGKCKSYLSKKSLPPPPPKRLIIEGVANIKWKKFWK